LDFHQLQLDKLQQPLEAVQMDELHGRVFGREEKKGARLRIPSRLRAVARWVAPGFMRRWRSRVDS
jgi:hypothetical protein